MFAEERKQNILKLLEDKNSLSTEEISRELYASRSTIRRALIELEEEGFIKRFYGGVTLMKRSSFEDPAQLRITANKDKKAEIAEIASTFLRDNMVIFLDSSSTVYHLIYHLDRFSNLKIITNNLQVALELSNRTNLSVFVIPGYVKNKSTSTVGQFSTMFLKNFFADISFLSCKAFDATGTYEGDEQQAFSKLALIENSKRHIMLADSTKADAKGYFFTTDYHNIECFITDKLPNREIVERMESRGCKIITP